MRSLQYVVDGFSPQNKDNIKNTVTTTGRNDSDDMDVCYQALGCLYTVLVPDAHAKMNLAKLRQLVLSQGIVDMTQIIQRKFRENENINSVVSSLLEIIMSDWS